MFDFAWSEIALIGVVALVLIGPKDMPIAIKAVSDMIKKARKMAGEFQGHVDEMVKDTSIAEVRQQINEIRNFDIRGAIEKHVDADGSLRSAMTDDPLAPSPPKLAETEVATRPVHEFATPPAESTAPPPAFIPPSIAAAVPPPPAVPEGPPAFIPPNRARPAEAYSETASGA